jgi:hypothetical protein
VMTRRDHASMPRRCVTLTACDVAQAISAERLKELSKEHRKAAAAAAAAAEERSAVSGELAELRSELAATQRAGAGGGGACPAGLARRVKEDEETTVVDG